MARFPTGQPFTQTWKPVSYRAAYTYEPIKDLMFYSMYATAYDPAAAAVFSVSPGNSLQLTSSQTLRNRRQATVLGWQSGVDRRRSTTSFNAMFSCRSMHDGTDVAGEVASKGVEVAAAVSPIEGLKLWGNAAFTHARFVQFRRVDRQHAPERGSSHRQCGGILSFQSLALAGRVRRLGAPCRNPFLFQDDAHDIGRLYDGGRLCVRGHPGQGYRACRNSKLCA